MPHDSEEIITAILGLVVDRPGSFGRLRCARIVGGYDLGHDQDHELDRHAVATAATLPVLVEFVDDLLDGGLLAQTAGARPTLVPTRAGWRALDALEAAGGEARIGA